MKKILLLFVLFLAIGQLYAQTEEIDVPDTLTVPSDTVLLSTDFEFVDTIYYEFYNPNEWYYKDWEHFQNGDTITSIRYRISDEGVQQKMTEISLKREKVKVKHTYSSKLKEKKAKRDKNK